MEQKAPSLGQRWRESRPTKTLLLWACIGTMLLTITVGFTWGGWITGGKARYAAENMAKDAVARRLAPICVVRVKADPERAMKLKELSAVSSYGQSDYVEKQGWATMPGEAGPDSRVAEECVKLLAQLQLS
jgi:hypothetical protein